MYKSDMITFEDPNTTTIKVTLKYENGGFPVNQIVFIFSVMSICIMIHIYLCQGGIKFATVTLSVCPSFRPFVSRFKLILLLPLF